MTNDSLAQLPLFCGIAESDIAAILTCLSATRKEFKQGECVIWQGDTVEKVGILLSGSAQSTKTDATGKLVIVTLIRPGDYIGVLLAASHNRTSPVSVRAVEDLVVLFIPLQSLLSRRDCPHHPELLSNLLNGIAEKALVLHDRNDCLIRPTIREKVLVFLAQQAHNAGSRSFIVPMNRDAMAEYLDVNRSALSRELSWMKRDGLIDYHHNRFHLRNTASLSPLG